MIHLPQYRKLYEILRQHILDGVYKEGELLPSENELCAVHNLTRPTVRHALDSLLNDGLIVKKQGKGSIVRNRPRNIGILSISGTASAIGSSRLKTRILQKPVVKGWDDPFTFELSQIEKESGCIYIERLRYVEGEPVFYDINHIPNINLPRFTARSLHDKSLFDELRRNFQIEIIGGEQNLKAVNPSAKIREMLELKMGEPVLYMERKLHTNREGFYIYSTIYFNSEKHAIYGSF
jgi:GntR family transcriptional regulator/GntR family frlABCD operon transcriptional regulator